MNKRKYMAGIDSEMLLADGFDEAIIGYIERAGQSTIPLYDTDKCIEILMSEGMTDEEATEYFWFNTAGAYVGDRTPAFITFLEEDEE